MKTRNKFYILLFVLLLMGCMSFARKTPPTCPEVVAGRVEVLLDANTGAGTGEAVFGCQFETPPVVVITPNFDAAFNVERMFVMTPDDGLEAGISVLGTPGQRLTVNWVATRVTPSSGKVLP